MWLDVTRTHQSVTIRELPWSSGLQPNESVCDGKQHQATLPTTQLLLCSWLHCQLRMSHLVLMLVFPPAETLWTATGLTALHESDTSLGYLGCFSLETTQYPKEWCPLWTISHSMIHIQCNHFWANSRQKIRVWLSCRRVEHNISITITKCFYLSNLNYFDFKR